MSDRRESSSPKETEADSRNGYIRWSDLSSGEKLELSNVLPAHCHESIISGDEKTLVEVAQRVEAIWGEYERILDERGITVLEERKDQIEEEVGDHEKPLIQFRKRRRELSNELGRELNRHGALKEGEDTSCENPEEVSVYASFLVDQFKQLNSRPQRGTLMQISEEISNARLRLRILKEVLWRKKNFRETAVPDLIKRCSSKSLDAATRSSRKVSAPSTEKTGSEHRRKVLEYFDEIPELRGSEAPGFVREAYGALKENPHLGSGSQLAGEIGDRRTGGGAKVKTIKRGTGYLDLPTKQKREGGWSLIRALIRIHGQRMEDDAA